MTKFGLKKLGFHDEDITELRDPIFEEFHQTIMNISSQINENVKKGINSLLFVYFAGHGQLRDGHQVGVLNDKRVMNLEKYLRTFAT